MSPTPGILYVTMQPSPDLPPAAFHDWYNNEHGPNRLRLPFIKNGFRYRAIDLSSSQSSSSSSSSAPSSSESASPKHEWMAIYDTPSMQSFDTPSYTALREAPVQTQRERDIRPSVQIDRRSYDLLGERKRGAGFVEADEMSQIQLLKDGERKRFMVAEYLQPRGGKKNQELEEWLSGEYASALEGQGKEWLRTRVFVTSEIEGKDEVEYLVLHEFGSRPEVRGDGFAVSAAGGKKILDECVTQKTARFYELFYTFGAAPRDLENFVADGKKEWVSEATKTKTVPAETGDGGAVESYVTTRDGVDLPYRLEGSSDPDAPLIVLSNSILVQWGIWDGFVKAFLKEMKGYRVLRYQTRGRESKTGEGPVTVDVLASDVVALLDALRVPKAACVMGVSLGGTTALNVALSYPDRVGSFIACDTSDKSPNGNSKTWSERIEVAEKESMTGQNGEKIVGGDLAELTVRRWFVKESYDGGAMEKECERVKTMVVNNSLDGFKKSVQALWEYDMQPKVKDAKVRGRFVVGSGDGVLPKTMKDMASRYGGEAECVVIEGAGHLPMVEKANEVADVAIKLLSS